MTSRKANRAVIRGQLRGAAISVMDALNEELNAGMPAGQLRDAAESLRASVPSPPATLAGSKP